jgi:trehalose 2-sulfotransferase
MIPTTSYIICAMPRSGTHLLAEALQNTGRAGKPDEYFICDHKGQLENERGNIAEQYGKKSLEEFRDLVLELGSTPNKVFGVIIMWSYFHTILDNYRTLPTYRGMQSYELVNKLLYNPKYIWLIRRDKVKQAISIVKALQTNVWRGDMAAQSFSEPKFDYQKIEHYRQRLQEAEAGWEFYFNSHSIEPCKVVYEDLAKTYEETAYHVLRYLQLPTENLTFAPRKLHKQADQLSDEWLAQYEAIRQSRLVQPPATQNPTWLARKGSALKHYLHKWRKSLS